MTGQHGCQDKGREDNPAHQFLSCLSHRFFIHRKEKIMPAPLIAAAISSIGSYLGGKGLDLLSGIFKGAADEGTKKVAALIEEKTGIDINKAAEAPGLSDAELVKLKEFELQYQEQLMQHTEALEQLNLEYEKARFADTENARKMQEKAMENEDPFVRRFIYLYAILLTVLSFGFLYLVLFNPNEIIRENSANKDLVNTITGFLLGTTMSAVIGFFFGSSSGSADKGKQIANLQNKLLEKNS
jgi:hypothetical protein